MEIDLKAAGKRIKEIRGQHKYSMALFSNLVGNSSASTVNNWEKGNNLPKQERLKKIAILGNTTVDWIRYGDFEEYVKQLLSEANLKEELKEDQLNNLVQTLKNQKITYSQDLKILTTANELYPDLFETSYQSELSEKHASLISEDLTTYRIEQNDIYRTVFLPKMEDLLSISDEKEINASVLFIVFDLLKRTESSKNFLSVPQIFTMVSEILTNDIIYKNMPLSKAIDYTNFADETRKGTILSDKLVTKKYAQTKNELTYLLDTFYEEYNDK